MTELLTAAQMRTIEAAAIASGEVTGLELMERAGRGVVEAVWEEWPELKAGSFRAVVLCGPGNNGGDGFVVARLLKEWGWEVEVFLYGDPEKMPPDARVNYERWVGMGEVQRFDNLTVEIDSLVFQKDVKLVVDALFGIGISRPLEGVLRRVVEYMNADGDLVPWRPTFPKFLSIDIPSGCCADSGRVMGAMMPSDCIVTFHHEKLGHRLDSCASAAKTVRVVDIGLGSRKRELRDVELISGKQTRFSASAYCRGNWLDKDEPSTSVRGWPQGLNKFSHGHALILSGPSGQGGAARLSARGALRIGAGLVTLGCSPEAIPENAAQLTAIMLRPIGDAAALANALQDKRINALCLGPGLGLDRAAALLAVALSVDHECPPYVVFDADALTALSRDPALFAQLNKTCVLTPHAGEFARLFPDIAAKLDAPATTGPAYSKVDATREAAKRAGCTILYKGPDTVIADPTGRCSINSAHYERSAPWLATAGSGDVLAGFITGLLARGFAPMQAAETAAWLHVECARSFGPGLIAEDLPEELPKVFRWLGL